MNNADKQVTLLYAFRILDAEKFQQFADVTGYNFWRTVPGVIAYSTHRPAKPDPEVFGTKLYTPEAYSLVTFDCLASAEAALASQAVLKAQKAMQAFVGWNPVLFLTTEAHSWSN